MGEQVIVLTDLTKQYGNFTAVDHIRLNIRKGEIFGLLGPNGAGKSTTILMMLGLTEPTSGTVEICGINTSKLPLLSNEEKKELIQKIQQGDKKAREQYIHGNLRLVLSIIQRFHNSNENIDDLFQIGCIGLMKAIDNFDVSQDVKFSTYAVPMNILCRRSVFK